MFKLNQIYRTMHSSMNFSWGRHKLAFINPIGGFELYEHLQERQWTP